MGKNGTFESLKGQLLVAMPQIDDLRFEKAVIYLYEHTPESAAGIVINHPASRMGFNEILDQLKIDHPPMDFAPTLLLGGPDKFTNGYILHTPDYRADTTLCVSDTISLTLTQEILLDIAHGKGPQKSLIALGCASWISGQLEDELMSNVWLTAPATDTLIFDVPFAERWAVVLNQLGIRSPYLSTEFGKA